MDLLVLAKEPRAGRVKTRLCPPCTPAEAAALARAALADTLAAALATGADRVVLALDGRPGDWCPAGIEVVPQGVGLLDRRLATAWSAVGGPALQIGMDTPQVGADELDAAMADLSSPGVDAVFGPASDGGWWAVGMAEPDPSVFLGIGASRPDTGAVQRAALVASGRRVADLAEHRDVDVWGDVAPVVAVAPHGRFAAMVAACGERVP